MVSENNIPETESAVESTGAELVSPEITEPSIESPSVAETTEPVVEEQQIDSAQADMFAQPTTPVQTETQRTYSQDEFAKLQSANDKRIAETEKNNKLLQDQLADARRTAEENTLNEQVAVYKEQQRQEWISKGLDEQSADQMASRVSDMAKQAYITELANSRTTAENQRMMQEINGRSQMAKAYELATQNGINFSDLEGFTNPTAMEQHAKALGRIKKLEQRLQGNTASQTYGTSQPSADVAPTNAESVIDRYNSGDPGITTEQANAAARKLGMPDVSY